LESALKLLFSRMKYNFDKIVDRRRTNAMATDGYREYLFGDVKNLDLGHWNESDLISMWIADMEFQTSDAIIKALKDRVEHGIFGYTQIFEQSYKDAFLKWSQTNYEWSFEKNHLVTSNGIIPALFDLAGFMCKADEKILIVTPSYAFFKHTADHNNLELVCSDLLFENGTYKVNLLDLESKAKDPKVTLCIFCNPHNPTGRVWTNTELVDIGNVLLRNNVRIISDEVHCDLLRRGKSFTPMSKLFPDSKDIITCMAASKTFNLAGFMLANIIIPDDKLRAKWYDGRIPIDNPFSIVATEAAYTHGHDWLDQLTTYLDANFIFLKSYLEHHLPESVFSIPDATYLAWVDMNAYFSKDINLTLFFAKHAGVLLEGGNMFVSNADGFIRLNLACPKSRLEEGLIRITKAILEK